MRSLILAGLALGWLIGLSGSPVVQGIVVAATGLVVAIASALAGMTPPSGKDLTLLDRINLSPKFIASLLVGLAIGSTGGVYVRAHNLLGMKPHDVVAGLKEAGFTQEEIKKLFVPNVAATIGDVTKPIGGGQLFSSTSPDECAVFKVLTGDALVSAMMASSDPKVSSFAQRCRSCPDCVKAAVEELLCK